ncbi:MAG: transcription elongation factor [Betaproteobacteria bacterium]|nr:MAG: transcription elongation factor [Betaproteobacteria bacterium]
MPEKRTVARARRKARAGKAPTTQAGEFVREEIHHVRERKHGARSAKQAIAIGLSKARRAGVKLPPRGRKVSKAKHRPSSRRSHAVKRALRREPHRTASRKALSRQTRRASRARSA